MTAALTLTFTGPVTIITADVDAITARLDSLGDTLSTVNEALAATAAKVDALTAARTADRDAFDALAVDIRAFIASVAIGGLSPEQQAQADSILTALDAGLASEQTQTADESALTDEVPTA
jgi:hypothetical protein